MFLLMLLMLRLSDGNIPISRFPRSTEKMTKENRGKISRHVLKVECQAKDGAATYRSSPLNQRHCQGAQSQTHAVVLEVPMVDQQERRGEQRQDDSDTKCRNSQTGACRSRCCGQGMGILQSFVEKGGGEVIDRDPVHQQIAEQH